MRYCFGLLVLLFVVGCSGVHNTRLVHQPTPAASVQQVKALSLVSGVPVELGRIRAPEVIPVTIYDNSGVTSFIYTLVGVNSEDVYSCSARETVERIFKQAIDLNFRATEEDVPLAVLGVETVACFLEVKRHIATCDLKMNVFLFEKGEEGDERRVLFKRMYTRQATSRFYEGQVPEAFYQAVSEICNAFLTDLSKTRYLMTQMVEGDFTRRTGKSVKKPIVLKFAYTDDESNRGECVVDFCDYDAQMGDSWAIGLIKKACYDKLGVSFTNEAVRFKIDDKLIANNRGTYRFSIRLLKEYEVAYKPHPVNKGEITINYGLMKKTPEEAYLWAKDSIEMILNDQGIVIEAGSEGAKAQYQLGPVVNNAADKSITMDFWLVN